MIRTTLAVLSIAVFACGGTKATPSTPPASVQAIDYQALREGAVCDAGNWVPQSQEPPHYVACTADSECVKMSMPGCCSETQVAIRRDHACGNDLGSSCDMECTEGQIVWPEGSGAKHAACVDRRCSLR